MAECCKKGCTQVPIYTLGNGMEVCLNHKHAWLVFERLGQLMKNIPWNLKKSKKPKK